MVIHTYFPVSEMERLRALEQAVRAFVQVHEEWQHRAPRHQTGENAPAIFWCAGDCPSLAKVRAILAVPAEHA